MNIVRLPIPSDNTAQEFGQDLYVGRQDPSDPEACFVFLQELYPERWREIMANMERTLDVAGQLWIDADLRRAG